MTITILYMMLAAVVTVFVVDLSGFSDTVCRVWAKMIRVRSVESVKPFTCSLCMTWWVTLVTGCCWYRLSWEVAAVAALLAFFSTTIASALRAAKELAEAVIGLINHITDKLWNRLH